VGVRCKRVRYKSETVATYIPPMTNTWNSRLCELGAARILIISQQIVGMNSSPELWYDHINPFVFQPLDVALGLEYLHNMSPKIIHGDLRGVCH
jgi:hypothetical protein